MTDYITLSLQKGEARDLLHDLKYARKLSLMNIKDQLDNAMNRTVKIEGWKGKDNVEFIHEDNIWRITEHHKDKVTGEVKHRVTKLPDNFVGSLWDAMRTQCEIGINYDCYEIASLINWNWKELWKERKEYFQQYYFPLKVLEYKGFIAYDSKSKIRRLR